MQVAIKYRFWIENQYFDRYRGERARTKRHLPDGWQGPKNSGPLFTN